ncbi:MAG TPA: M20/M25/M40 family metallo-hydrolase [Tenuifilaceae bacterium]|nr:M20/M25/M40 family metallo-hydrolase [Tenuifilaceae bacterium]
MKKYYTLLVILLLFLNATQSQPLTGTGSVANKQLLHHVSILASDSMGGRFPGTTYDRISAKYIRDQLQSYGLSFQQKNGYQFFAIQTFNPNRATSTFLVVNGKRLQYGNDYTALATSGNDSLCAKAVFVGYGRTGGSADPDDYKNVSVKKKWAVMLVPSLKVQDASSGELQQVDLSCINGAVGHEAAGIILIASEAENRFISMGSQQQTLNLPVFILNGKSSELILKSIGPADEVIGILERGGQNLSQDLPLTICGKAGKPYNEIETQNVVGVLRGSDPNLADEYIVVGAHYDHLGMGGKEANSRMPDTVAVHNGADDNASGVAVMLEIAREMASQKKQLKRSVVFAAFGAEEMGLVGSQRFLDSAVVPIPNIKAMVNLDMVGRMVDGKLEIGGTKTSMQAEAILNELNADSALAISLSPDGFGPSDHASFYSKNIPVFFFTTGIHQDYHTPFDDVDKLNLTGMAQVTDYAYRLIYKLSTMDSSLTFSKSGSRMAPTNHGNKVKVKLGIMPDVSGSTGNGLKVIAVSDDKPAMQAGIQTGDIITSLGGVPVTNIYDYTEQLGKLEPGITVEVKVLRNNQELTFALKL